MGKDNKLFYVGLFVIGLLIWQSGALGTAGAIGGGNSQEPPVIQVAGQACGNNGQTAVTLALVNGEDEAGGFYNATAYFLNANGQIAATSTLSDGTATSATVNCGEQYTIAFISADADQGDNSMVRSASASGGVASVNDGKISFTGAASTARINAVGSHHGILEMRLFSNTNNAYFYNNEAGDSSTTDYETDGVTWSSTTDNTTATAVGSGGQFESTLEFRATRSTVDFSDFGYYILIDAAPASWQQPSCTLGGVQQTDVKGSLTVKESQQFSGYEYVYRVNSGVKDDLQFLRCNWKALAGVNPGASDDLQVDFASIGQTLATDGVSVQRGATDDDSAATVTFTVQDNTIDVS